jgi:hypothetical protein
MRMCKYNFDVVYQGLYQSIRNTEKYTFVYEEDREMVEELINFAEEVLNNLNKIEFRSDDE